MDHVVSAICNLLALVLVAAIVAGFITVQQTLKFIVRGLVFSFCVLTAVCLGKNLWCKVLLPWLSAASFWDRLLVLATVALVSFVVLTKIFQRGES